MAANGTSNSTNNNNVNNNQQGKQVPKDAQVIMSIMNDMGISDFEPQVITQLLEFTYRYVTSTLEDAKIYATHANKKYIDVDDVQLAVQMQLDKNFTTPPPRDLLLEVARAKNSIPLPQIKPHCGLRLPPDRYCMTACNYELKSSKKPVVTNVKSSNIYSAGGQGAIFKAQIKPAMKRTVQAIPRAQNITIPKPTIKLSAGSIYTNDGGNQAWKQATQISNVGSVQTPMDEPPSLLIKRKASEMD